MQLQQDRRDAASVRSAGAPWRFGQESVTLRPRRGMRATFACRAARGSGGCRVPNLAAQRLREVPRDPKSICKAVRVQLLMSAFWISIAALTLVLATWRLFAAGNRFVIARYFCVGGGIGFSVEPTGPIDAGEYRVRFEVGGRAATRGGRRRWRLTAINSGIELAGRWTNRSRRPDRASPSNRVVAIGRPSRRARRPRAPGVPPAAPRRGCVRVWPPAPPARRTRRAAPAAS